MPARCTPPAARASDSNGAQVRYDALISLAAKWNRVSSVEDAALALVANVKFVLSLDVWRFALREEAEGELESAVLVVEGTLERMSVIECKLGGLSSIERALFCAAAPVLLDAEMIAVRRDELPTAVRGRAMNAVYGLASQGTGSRADHVLVIGTRATLSPLDLKFAALLGGLFADKVRQLRAEQRLRIAYKELADRDSRIYADLCESRDFQRSLLPKLEPMSGLEIATVFEPIEMVGGDVYDVTVLPDGRVRIFVVDATGHGLQAAMRTMVLLSEYNNLKYRAATAGDLLRALNKRLFEHGTPLDLLSPAVCADIYQHGDSYACVIANAGDSHRRCCQRRADRGCSKPAAACCSAWGRRSCSRRSRRRWPWAIDCCLQPMGSTISATKQTTRSPTSAASTRSRVDRRFRVVSLRSASCSTRTAMAPSATTTSRPCSSAWCRNLHDELGDDMEGKPYFELNFRPNFALVTVVRRFVSEFNRRFLDEPDSSRIALATHELLENAVKFSEDGATTIRMEIVEADGDRTIRVILRNRAAPAHIDAVKRILAGIAEASTPFGFYQQLLVKRAKVKDGSGGLGIARICAEGEMAVRCAVEGNVIEIEAATAIEKGAYRA
jgi:hypothetical protein